MPRPSGLRRASFRSWAVWAAAVAITLLLNAIVWTLVQPRRTIAAAGSALWKEATS